jgi:uncharacterized membrane protein YgcG
MDWKRFWRHVAMTPARAAACFTSATLEAIQRQIVAGELRHSGEVMFIVESELTTAQLLAGLSSRDRAREVFAAHGVWNTEANNGVLIYVLLADRKVEIVADRGIDARVEPGAWQAICDAIDVHFHKGEYEAGAISGVTAVSRLLEAHFPAGPAGSRNELGDRPVML